MSNNITSLVTGLLVLGGFITVTVLLNNDAEPSVISSVEQKDGEIQHGGLTNTAGESISAATNGIEIPEIVMEPYPVPVEVEPIDFVEVVVEKERNFIEIGVEAEAIRTCGWSCDGRCGLRVMNPMLYEYEVPVEEPVFESLVFPNPAIDRLTLRLTVSEEVEPMIQLYSSTGAFLRTIEYDPILEGENDISVNILDLPKGIYFLVLYAKEIKETIRFIKQ